MKHIFFLVFCIISVYAIDEYDEPSIDEVDPSAEEFNLTQPNAESCSGDAVYNLNNYLYLTNNQWGASSANPGYRQCINSNPVSWTYEFWGSQYSVKSYPAIIGGWHWGYRFGKGAGGLPKLIYTKPKLITSWTIAHTNLGNYECLNTAYDIWFGGNNEDNPQNPQGELMIWLNRVNQGPLGKFVETVNIWGMEWDFFLGENSWPVYSFLNKKNIWSISNVDLFDFVDYLWEKKNWLDGRKFVVGIEAGTEIIQGKGTFTVSKYTLNVS